MSSHLQFDAQCGGRKPADVRLEQREGGDLQQLMHSNPPNSSEGFVLLYKDCIIRALPLFLWPLFLGKIHFSPSIHQVLATLLICLIYAH